MGAAFAALGSFRASGGGAASGVQGSQSGAAIAALGGPWAACDAPTDPHTHTDRLDGDSSRC
ncbi:hypothetical protein PF008_g29003 [Phytophthora fragariae]|uniref:Uncharacterized protein n=1 Tax=Phytophthora fragariae TaxID=53985 RepID=A0A6G0QA72_9STRA|nr:hypothetical protein PF008_g29003 [Phytophthora fragariae]